jgi:hypothetical protein
MTRPAMSSENALRLVVVLTLAVAGFGCRQRGVDLPTAPVSGQATYRGRPLAGGRIAFIHSSGHAAGTELTADGRFTLAAYQGNNRILIECFDFDRPGSAKKRPQMMNEAVSLIPSRYTNYGTSGLTFEVKPGEDNKADFTLRD